MEPRRLKRFISLLAALTVTLFAVWGVLRYVADIPPGDYQVRQGDILLSDGKYEEALLRFEEALQDFPGHRGAMMGRAIAFLQSGRFEEAEAAFTELIGFIGRTLTVDDPTDWAALAAAHANRGILHDRVGRHAEALADYRIALAIDAEAVSGPGLIDRVLYGMPDPATVQKRADYLSRQLALPEGERVLTRPELDARQRMHKP